ncbi:L-arabinose isomerase [Glycomyces niveus]|jgi:L-arabinose isomerase|uniref:L-arabinose isomerase n=1 Tax=Glycomyces niveus TaxID=2820287 RepID=A0ABS3U0V8_9ACTN|nr:L-arabinose isomerase [Glycomyces sp. NEAU-S30]MBO3731327.1 L-arabinose isomerase [Glycomyces sp. NEAU-S30]
METKELWFVTGSQHLYGPEAIEQVAQNSADIVAGLDAAPSIPVKVVAKPVLTTPEEIKKVLLEANADDACIGVITWMHTFSPSKMWIAGLGALQKPLLHLHTQHNRDLPWADIDMDFMNLNQAAHGDREFGYMLTRLRHRRKTVVGHWADARVQGRIGNWARAALGWNEVQNLKLVRFGDNMRYVGVTEGDKVEAQIRLGVEVNTYGVNELVERVATIEDKDVDDLVKLYEADYDVVPELRVGGERHESLRDAARIELALRSVLEEHGAKAFTDTFEDLGALKQLPGIAVQRLMADGYGFGGEGDWKTAVLVRVMKVMAQGLEGGTSFMEDYTYNLGSETPQILGAHMLEVCPTIASAKPAAEIHPLGIGGKEDPVRLVFTAPPGPAIAVGLMDFGTRLRLVANEVDTVEPDEDLPNLPVARAVWVPRPDLETAAEAWLTAGGPHHTSYTQAFGREVMEDFAEIAGLELVVIGEGTTATEFKRELRWNQVYHHLEGGI